MSAKVVTVRDQLKSSVSDFLDDAGMACIATQEALVSLVVALSDHREEGKSLFPRVLICDNLRHALGILQGSEAISLGTGARAADTVLLAIKKCAPLATASWAIWIERQDGAFEFGVFREPPTPTSLDLRHTVLATSAGALQAVLLGQAGPGNVELLGPGDLHWQIHLTGERADQVSSKDTQARIADWAVGEFEDVQAREAYHSFLTTTLHELLRQGHGALIAVVEVDYQWGIHTEDAVILPDPIDLSSAVEIHREQQSSEALARLLSFVDLLAGMLNSDGITVLDTQGRLLGFNWFIQTENVPARQQMGGARHRAFEALKLLVDDGSLRGVFVRSSNGVDQAYGKVGDV